MGTGIGRGENRAVDAAKMAIESPLLDSVTIAGARGVLINITGGNEMTLGDVNTISDIVKEAVGEECEIIFGAVSEPAMQGEVRVTVIATGFEQKKAQQPSGLLGRNAATPIIPIDPAQRNRGSTGVNIGGHQGGNLGGSPLGTGSGGNAAPKPRPQTRPTDDLSDMEIPTFIRRQMD